MEVQDACPTCIGRLTDRDAEASDINWKFIDRDVTTDDSVGWHFIGRDDATDDSIGWHFIGRDVDADSDSIGLRRTCARPGYSLLNWVQT